MVIDCYTHTWESPEQLGAVAGDGRHVRPPMPDVPDQLPAGRARHEAAADPVDVTFVLGFKSAYLGAEIPNSLVASYVRQHPGRLVGFAGIDPRNPKEAIADLHEAADELLMRGVAVAPAAQDFHPSNSQAMLVYAEASERGMPVIFHTGANVCAATKLEYAHPMLLDEVARDIPNLRIVIAHMGTPWIEETVVLLGKHPNVYAEISWVLQQPWAAYQALLLAHQYGVMDKLLFGSGFPYRTASACIEELYGINHFCHGTNLPAIPREELRGIVERDALTLLGIADGLGKPEKQTVSSTGGEDHQVV